METVQLENSRKRAAFRRTHGAPNIFLHSN